MMNLACSGNSKNLLDKDFGDDWPFTVSGGTVQCLGESYVVIFKSNGVIYALNDAARATNEYKDIRSIIKIDENYTGRKILMDTSPIEFEGLKLCNRNY